MLIRPKGWWPTPHVVDSLTDTERGKAITWCKNQVNKATRYVTSKELKEALVAKIEEVTGRAVALPAHALNAIMREVDNSLRADEMAEGIVAPGSEPEP